MITFVLSFLRFNRQTDAALERHIEEVWTQRVSKEPWLFNEAKFRLHSFCLASPQCPSSFCAVSKKPCSHSPKEPLCCAQNGLDCRDISLDQTENVEDVIQQATTSPQQHSSVCGAARPPADKNSPGSDTGPLLILKLGLTCYRDYLGTNWSCRVEELCQRGEAEFNDPLALLAQPLGVGSILCTDDGQVVLIRRSQRVAEAGGLLDIPGGHPEPKVKRNKRDNICFIICITD